MLARQKDERPLTTAAKQALANNNKNNRTVPGYTRYGLVNMWDSML